MVVDNQVAVIGGRNLASNYFGYHQEDNFRDLEVVTGGSIVQDLATGFDGCWNNRWSFPVVEIMAQRAGPGTPRTVDQSDTAVAEVHVEQTLQQREQDWVQLVESDYSGQARLLLDRPPKESPAVKGEAPVQVGQESINQIDAARSEVWLVSAYLIPTDELEAAIQRAENRGVKARILTNSINSNNHLSAHKCVSQARQDAGGDGRQSPPGQGRCERPGPLYRISRGRQIPVPSRQGCAV